jgi:hypothetical protein
MCWHEKPIVTTLQLYIDDLGTRNPDNQSTARTDRMDHLALGGILIDRENLDLVHRPYSAFTDRYDVRHQDNLFSRDSVDVLYKGRAMREGGRQ